jgi:hypothetical protein
MDYKQEFIKKLSKQDEKVLAFEKIVKAASLLDEFGFTKEADIVDSLIEKKAFVGPLVSKVLPILATALPAALAYLGPLIKDVLESDHTKEGIKEFLKDKVDHILSKQDVSDELKDMLENLKEANKEEASEIKNKIAKYLLDKYDSKEKL